MWLYERVRARHRQPDHPREPARLGSIGHDKLDVRVRPIGRAVVTATDGREALKIFKAQKGKVQVVITELSMPVMSGVALVRALRELEPTLKVIAASGLDDESKRLFAHGNWERLVGA